MDDTHCRQFFLEPAETYHRRYEALRTFFVEGCLLNKAGQGGRQEVGVGGTVMPWENEFRYRTFLRKRERLW
jgi:hypothetical protein